SGVATSPGCSTSSPLSPRPYDSGRHPAPGTLLSTPDAGSGRPATPGCSVPRPSWPRPPAPSGPCARPRRTAGSRCRAGCTRTPAARWSRGGLAGSGNAPEPGGWASHRRGLGPGPQTRDPNLMDPPRRNGLDVAARQKSWRLNERHYGSLQGLNKADLAARLGEEQVRIWRRSYATSPPRLDKDDPRYPGHGRRYAELPVRLSTAV